MTEHDAMRRVHRDLHFRQLVARGPDADVIALRTAVDKELAHVKLIHLFHWPTTSARKHGHAVEVTIAHAIYVLGLSESSRKAALRGTVGKWTQRKIRNPKLRSPLDRRRVRRRRPVIRRWREKTRVKTPKTMFDAVDLAEVPVDAEAVLGYTGGSWPTYHELAHRFPNARIVAIAIAAHEDADLLDVESGDASPEQAPDWFRRQHDEHAFDYNLRRRGIYAAVSQLVEVFEHMRAAGIQDQEWIPMSAHTGQGKHLCGPRSCGYPGLTATVPCTQYDWAALGRNLDESVVSREFWD